MQFFCQEFFFKTNKLLGYYLSSKAIPYELLYLRLKYITAQKMKFYIKDFVRKCDQCGHIYCSVWKTWCRTKTF